MPDIFAASVSSTKVHEGSLEQVAVILAFMIMFTRYTDGCIAHWSGASAECVSLRIHTHPALFRATLDKCGSFTGQRRLRPVWEMEFCCKVSVALFRLLLTPTIPFSSEGYHFLLGDHLLYPRDYVSVMIKKIEAMKRRAVVGVESHIFTSPFSNYKSSDNHTRPDALLQEDTAGIWTRLISLFIRLISSVLF